VSRGAFEKWDQQVEKSSWNEKPLPRLVELRGGGSNNGATTFSTTILSPKVLFDTYSAQQH